MGLSPTWHFHDKIPLVACNIYIIINNTNYCLAQLRRNEEIIVLKITLIIEVVAKKLDGGYF